MRKTRHVCRVHIDRLPVIISAALRKKGGYLPLGEDDAGRRAVANLTPRVGQRAARRCLHHGLQVVFQGNTTCVSITSGSYTDDLGTIGVSTAEIAT